MDKAFKEWCDKIGISPKSHDYSIAKAAWQEAVRVTINAFKTHAKGGKQ
jgi:hypothetical protein